MLALILMMTGATAFAQGNGMAGINEATKMVTSYLDTAYQAHHCSNGIDELGGWVKIGSDHLGRFVDARHTIALGKGCRTCHH